MNVHGIASELWWFGNEDEICSLRGFSIWTAFKHLREEFHFFEMPTAVSENYTFKQGNLEERVQIKQLVLYAGATHITIAGDFDGADQVFEKLVEIFVALGIRQPTTPPVRFYRSTIICDFEKTIDSLFSKLETITEIVQRGIQVPNAQVHPSGIAFAADATTLPREFAAYNPTLFSINRKTDVEFSKNRCTCFANMKTIDHLTALHAIELLL